MTQDQNNSEKAIALQMVQQMKGINESQRTSILQMLELVPESQMQGALQKILEAQQNITQAQHQGVVELRKKRNLLQEEKVQAQDAVELQSLERELQ